MNKNSVWQIKTLYLLTPNQAFSAFRPQFLPEPMQANITIKTFMFKAPWEKDNKKTNKLKAN